MINVSHIKEYRGVEAGKPTTGMFGCGRKFKDSDFRQTYADFGEDGENI